MSNVNIFKEYVATRVYEIGADATLSDLQEAISFAAAQYEKDFGEVPRNYGTFRVFSDGETIKISYVLDIERGV